MPAGVFRPYTLQDVLGTMNQQTQDQTGSEDTPDGIGEFVESDESGTLSDSFTVSPIVAATAAWDQTTWGAFVWS